MKLPLPLALSALLLLGSLPVSAQPAHDAHHAGHAPAADEAASTAAYRAAMEDVHAQMTGMEYSGDADIDFARGMIPHHRAAIEMARIQLAEGDDPQMRKLAEEIIEAQEHEIAELETWLKANDTD